MPCLLKIDVEGFETEVIHGAGTLLHNQYLKAILIEMNGLAPKFGYDENLVHEKIVQYGFTPHTYDLDT